MRLASLPLKPIACPPEIDRRHNVFIQLAAEDHLDNIHGFRICDPGLPRTGV